MIHVVELVECLTIGKEWIQENINKKLKVELFGQELNDITYAICKSDFLMSDENPENIKGPFSSLSEDGFQIENLII